MRHSYWMTILGLVFICAGVVGLFTGHRPRNKGQILRELTKPAGLSTSPRARNEGPIPRIIFEQTALNFGKRTEGEEIKFRFPLYNKGNAKLVIENVRLNCRCADAEVSSRELPPGAKGYVEVSLLSRPARIQAKILIETNTLARLHELNITGVIEPRLVLSPSFIDFGDVWIGKTYTRRFSIENAPNPQNQGDILPMLQFESSCAELEARLVEERSSEFAKVSNVDSDRSDVELVLRAGGELGDRSAVVTVEAPIEEHILFRQLHVTWTVVGNIEVRPKSGFFSLVKRDQGNAATVHLINRVGESFDIEDVRCDSDQLKLNIKEIVPGSHYSVTASVTEQPLQKSVKGTITIQTTDKLQRFIVLPAKFLVLEAP